jgi:hypothetical protein
VLAIVPREIPDHLSRLWLRGLRLPAHAMHRPGERLGKLVKPTMVRDQIAEDL